MERWSQDSGRWEAALPYEQGQEGQTTRTLTSSAATGIYRVIAKLP